VTAPNAATALFLTLCLIASLAGLNLAARAVARSWRRFCRFLDQQLRWGA